jgi:hypothetical protein
MFDVNAVPVRLAFLWGFENGIAKLNLACPRKFDSLWENGACHFNVAIPHPATQVKHQPEEQEPSDLDDILEPKPKKKTGTLIQ